MSPPPYNPPISFPQRFVKEKFKGQFKKLIELIKKSHFNIPSTEAITRMPLYAKFLKEILKNKRKIDYDGMVAFIEECSTTIQYKLTPKLKDPGSFLIPCVIGNHVIDKCQFDLGASVIQMPLYLCRRLNLVS